MLRNSHQFNYKIVGITLSAFLVFKSRTWSPCALIWSFSAEALLSLLETGALGAGFDGTAAATGLDISFAAA